MPSPRSQAKVFSPRAPNSRWLASKFFLDLHFEFFGPNQLRVPAGALGDSFTPGTTVGPLRRPTRPKTHLLILFLNAFDLFFFFFLNVVPGFSPALRRARCCPPQTIRL